MSRDTKSASGRFLLRIDPGLHEALRAAARDAGVSLNDYCARSLAASLAPGSGLRAPAEVVGRAAALFGGALEGVVLYGSHARGEAIASSDVDVLVVVDRSVRLSRALYRLWDEAPIAWDAHVVEPHFVHAPGPEDRPSGTWAEVAIDGIVLFERSLALSRALVRIRHEILAGRLVRRTVHGQSYWSEAS